MLLVHEGFVGYNSGKIEGQRPNQNTTGLNTLKAYYDGSSPSRAAGFTLTTGLTFGALQTSGGALAFGNTVNVVGADISIGALDGPVTLWSSYLVQFSQPLGTANNYGALLRVGASPSDNGGARFTSWADSRATNSDKVAVGYSGSGGSDGNAGLEVGKTYIIISSFTRVGQTLSADLPGVATLWALDETQFADFVRAGGDEAALNSVTATAMATQTVTSGNYAFSSGDAFGLITQNSTGVFDEVRFGTTLESVTPVPEPSAAAVFAGVFCLAGAAWRRRRR